MKVLIVKTSSMGDVIHTLPAVTDALCAHPNIKFDWVVEENFAEIPALHPGIHRVIPVALRRWRSNPIKAFSQGEWGPFRRSLQESSYEKIIDAQGLLKSSFITWMARGPRLGLDRDSITEPLAVWAYQQCFKIPKEVHAIERLRQLFALSLCYALPRGTPDYGIEKSPSQQTQTLKPYVVFLHGTAQKKKLWPPEFWVELAHQANTNGYIVFLPWGNLEEKQRAEQIAHRCERAQVLSHKTLIELAEIFRLASGVVGVDSGLSHLAAVLGIPSVTLFSATSPLLTGVVGPFQINLWKRGGDFHAEERAESLQVESVLPEDFSPMLVWSRLNKMRERLGK